MENDDYKKKLIPMQLMALLPPIAVKFFYVTFVLSKNPKGCNYSPTSHGIYHMSQEDCDLALQTLIDNGIVNAIPNGDWYKLVVNYDKFKEFNYPFKDLFGKDGIKLSTEVTFKNNKVEGIINQLTLSEKEEMVKRLGDELASSTDKDRKKDIRDEMARECFLLSKKDANNC